MAALLRKYRDAMLQLAGTRRFRVLAIIMLLGFVLRILGLGFGLPNDSRPDEVPICNILINNLMAPFMSGELSLHNVVPSLAVGDYSPLYRIGNPLFLDYPSLYFYLAAIPFTLHAWFTHFGDWPGYLTAYELDPGTQHLIIRWISVLFGTAMIAAVSMLATRWSGRALTGPLAALLCAVNYLLVRNSHFGSVDMMLTFGVTLSLWAVLGYARQRTERRLALAAALIGLTTGVKYPAILLLLPLWAAIFRPFVREGRIDWAGFAHAVWKPTGLALIVFFLTTPWLLLDFGHFLRDFQYESSIYFAFRLPGIESGWLFYPAFTLWYGLGGLLLLAAAVGVAARFSGRMASLLADNAAFERLTPWVQGQSAEELPVRDRFDDILLLGFALAFLILLGFNQRVMTRYALPLLPVLLIYAALGIEMLMGMLGRLFARRPSTGWLVPALVVIVMLWQPLALSIGFDARLMQPDTRTLARDWIMQHVPPGQPVGNGPRLGQVYLPGSYGQLLEENGPEYLNPVPEIRISDVTPRTRLISEYSNPDLLRKLGVRYIIAFEGTPVFSTRPWELDSLAKAGTLVARFSPLKPGEKSEAVGRFDPYDAFFLPYADFHAFERPGPIVDIFDLAVPPAQRPQSPYDVRLTPPPTAPYGPGTTW